jgi:hypothetical protein
MTVEELLSSALRLLSRMPEMDTLREADALQEAQLIDLRVSALRSTAGLLFEFRTSLQFDEGNAALLIVRDLRDLRWCRDRIFAPLTALTVISSRVGDLDDHRVAAVAGDDGRDACVEKSRPPRPRRRRCFTSSLCVTILGWF